MVVLYCVRVTERYVEKMAGGEIADRRTNENGFFPTPVDAGKGRDGTPRRFGVGPGAAGRSAVVRPVSATAAV